MNQAMREAVLAWLRNKAVVTEHEPIWRLAAYWCVIVTFFTLPLLVWTIDISTSPAWTADKFQYLWSFHKVLAALLAAMLGLNSWDKRLLMKNGNGAEKKPDAAPKQ